MSIGKGWIRFQRISKQNIFFFGRQIGRLGEGKGETQYVHVSVPVGWMPSLSLSLDPYLIFRGHRPRDPGSEARVGRVARVGPNVVPSKGLDAGCGRPEHPGCHGRKELHFFQVFRREESRRMDSSEIHTHKVPCCLLLLAGRGVVVVLLLSMSLSL